MGNIHVLSFEIANLIAAGEVVERPSSVLKELIENSVDAGASHIVAEIKRGGVSLIRVTDDGCGIDREDMPVALKRHATSKIRSREDLGNIGTLGFRGEALAAIASVCRLTMITKTKDADSACMLTSEGGVVTDIVDVGAADGTTVVVEDLFFNVPARRKFLKKDATEAMNVAVLVEKVALSRPDISIQLLIDGEERFHTPGDGQLENTIYAVYGKDFSEKLLPIDGTVNRIHVYGYIGRSDNVRRNRNLENVFINGRYVKSMTVMAALEKAFTSYIAPECFPTCVLFADMPPSVVDVNVHPAKLEVKFSDEKAVFEAVYYTVRRALEEGVYRPDMTLKKTYTPTFRTEETAEQLRIRHTAADEAKADTAHARHAVPSVGKRPLYEKTDYKSPTFHTPVSEGTGASSTAHKNVMAAFEKKTYTSDNIRVASGVPGALAGTRHADAPFAKDPTLSMTPKDSLALLSALEQTRGTDSASFVSPKVQDISDDTPPYRYVGEAFDCYVMIEYRGDLLVIDKHAAHERVLFEDLKRQMLADTRVASQQLLLPVNVPLTADTLSVVRDRTDVFASVGYDVELLPDGVQLLAIPSLLEPSQAQSLFSDMADELAEGRGDPTLTDAMRREKMLYQTACKGAMKGGRVYDRSIIDWLVGKVLALPDITVCPHGRPIAYVLKKRELDKQFDRIK